MIATLLRRKQQPKVRAAVMPPPVDPALEAVTQQIAEVIRKADERVEAILQRLRAQLPKEEP